MPAVDTISATEATSGTHGKQYAVFARQLANPAKFKAELAAELEKPNGKRDLFRVWLQNGETLDGCVMHFKKKTTLRKTKTRCREGTRSGVILRACMQGKRT